MTKRFTITVTPELSSAQKAWKEARAGLDDAGDRRDGDACDRYERELIKAEVKLTAEGSSIPDGSKPDTATLVELDPAKRHLILVRIPETASHDDIIGTAEIIETMKADLAKRGIHGAAGWIMDHEVTIEEAPWISALERRAARLGVAGQQVLADALRKVLKLGVSSEREARLVLTAQGVWDEDVESMLKNDLGICVACKTDRLVAVLTQDGKAWEAEGCPACHCTWCFQAPKTLAEIPNGVRRMTWDEVKAKEIPEA